jgi:acetyl esterase/lipase
MGYVRRQLFVSALAANAIRPTPTWYTGVPAMLAGWLTTELSPHMLAAVLTDTALDVRRSRDSKHLLLGAVNAAAFAYVWRQSRTAEHSFTTALVETLGDDYPQRLKEAYADVDWEWKTPLQELVWPFKAKVKDVEVFKNIAYAPEHGRRGMLDIYKPKGDITGAPILVQVHGGAWRLGVKDQQGQPLMRHMASRGWVCMAMNYRLAPRSPFPAQITDVKRALAWMREHAEEYGADPRFVAITGGSAGGHLAALAALTPNDPDYQPGFEDADTSVQAAVPFYPVLDFAGATGSKAAIRMRDRFIGPKVVMKSYSEDPEPFENGSPYLRINEDAPPFYVIHGTNDTLVEVAEARAFVERLREVSHAPVAYTELTGTHHAFDVFPSVRSQASVRAVEQFLDYAYDTWRGRSTVMSHEDWESSDPQDEPAPA